MRIHEILVLAFALLGAAPIVVHADAFPERPINVIVPFAAGGATDALARTLMPYLEKHLSDKAQCVVLNKPGASGDIAVSALARAPADGYTVGFVSTPPLLSLPIERKTTYTWESFDIIGNMVDDPVNFSVHPDSPVKNLADLAAYAKANPGKTTIGTSGLGSDDHLATLLFERAAGVKLNHIPFKGSSEVRNALMSKTIMVAAINVGEALQFSKGGTQLRNLAQAGSGRSAIAPLIPTFKEQGFNVNLSAMRALAAPKGLPPAVRERLVKALALALADPEFQTKANEVLFQPVRYLSPKEFTDFLKKSDPEFRQLWKEVPWVDK